MSDGENEWNSKYVPLREYLGGQPMPVVKLQFRGD